MQIYVEGLTGPINFDQDGLRNRFYIEVLELQRNLREDDSYNKLARFQCTSMNCEKNDIELFRNYSSGEEITATMKNKRFKVIMRIGEPFLRKRYDGTIDKWL